MNIMHFVSSLSAKLLFITSTAYIYITTANIRLNGGKNIKYWIHFCFDLFIFEFHLLNTLHSHCPDENV